MMFLSCTNLLTSRINFDMNLLNFPAHPNIINIKQWFIADLPSDIDKEGNFSVMMPERINPDGFGRNRTMFIVMERYIRIIFEKVNFIWYYV